jgi:hypothetical protein
MLHTPGFPPPTFQRRLTLAWESLQLSALRRFIAAGHEVARFLGWLQPVKGWLWLLPAAFVIGLVSGVLSRM